MLINGIPTDRLSAADRGVQYGDGVFRTLRVLDGQLMHWPRHIKKLQQDCAALDIPCPAAELLLEEMQGLVRQLPDGVAKIIITRGVQEKRGYAPAAASPTRILGIAPAPVYPDSHETRGIKLHLCNLRMSHQPRLAGIKHLNRLENVLAAAEWNETDCQEGLLLDFSGNIIEGTRSNIFMLRNAELFTPDLSFCGVAGVQRDRVMEQTARHGMTCRVQRLALPELLAADEIFLVNSVIGVWPVREMPDYSRSRFPLTVKIQEWLKHAD